MPGFRAVLVEDCNSSGPAFQEEKARLLRKPVGPTVWVMTALDAVSIVVVVVDIVAVVALSLLLLVFATSGCCSCSC
jgi:hypothetical protein